MMARRDRRPMLPVAHCTTRYRSANSSVLELGHPPRWTLLHERLHPLAWFVGVLERPEHGLVVDGAIPLVEHALEMNSRVGRRLQDLLDRGNSRSAQRLVRHDAGD